MGDKKRHLLSRRAFVKAAAVTSAAATLAVSTGSGLAAAETAPGDAELGGNIERIRTCCRACGKMECGVWVTVQDGKAIRVEGDQSSFMSRGHCCTKSQSSLQACYHPDRLRYPMKRTNPKGEDPGWVRISWDEALQTCASKIKELTEKYGSKSLFSMNGTSRMWAMGGYAALKIALGTPNAHLASEICKGPRFFTTGSTDEYGSNWMATCEGPRVYVEWGSAPEYSNYDDSCRNLVHAAANADTYIIVDPRMTGMGKEADYWLNIRPGTDQAIALAWAKLILDNGLMDELYMKRWSNAAYLVVEDMEPSGGRYMANQGGVVDIKTRLLKECDLVEGGSIDKFYVHDATKAAAGATGNDALSYFDVETTQWEGEHITTAAAEANGRVVNEGTPWEGWLPTPTTFDSIDPDLYGTFDVTLKDGRTVKARPVWDMYAEMLEEWTPEKAEEITGVDAWKIKESCLAWATRPEGQDYGNGGIHLQLATDQTGNSYQTIRSIMLLSHMTGNLDTPAGNRGPTHAKYADSLWIPWWTEGAAYYDKNGKSNFQSNAESVSAETLPMTRWYNQWTDAYDIWRAVLEGNPYPIVGGMNDSGSFMNMNNSAIGWEAMNKLDFWAEINLWHHPTAECADILMPCYHWLEMRFPRISQGPHCGLGMNCRCVEAPGECRSDPQILVDFYEAMGMPWTSMGPDNFYPNEDDILEHMFSMSEMPFDSYKAFEEDFQKHGWQNAKKIYPKIMGTYRRYETGYMHIKPNVGGGDTITVAADDGTVQPLQVPGCDAGCRFGYLTPTAKYEVWPTLLESYGMGGVENVDESWMIPFYRESHHTPLTDPEMHQEYPFVATSGRRIPVYFHSEHRQLPWCREQWPVPRVEINPADAADLGIEQGDWVWIETPWGKIRQCADLYHGINPGVCNLEHAWWFPELSAPNHGQKLCDCNQLMDPENRDPIIGSACVRGILVKLYKATPDNSPFGNPVPCDDDGTEIIHDATDPRLKEWLPDYTLNGSDY